MLGFNWSEFEIFTNRYHTRCIGATSKMTMASKTYKCPFCAVLGGQAMFSLSENTYNRIYTTKKAVGIDDLKRVLREAERLCCKVDEVVFLKDFSIYCVVFFLVLE